MLIRNDDMEKRLNNPLNLINQIKNGALKSEKRNSAMSLFIRPEVKSEKLNPFNKQTFPNTVIPSEIIQPAEISTDNLITEGDAKIKLALAHDKALDVMTRAIDAAGSKLDDVRADRLPGVIVAMSKVVGSIRQERIERDKNNKGNEVHFHFFTPPQRQLSEYEVIEVAGVVLD